MVEMTLEELARHIEGRLEGDPKRLVHGCAPLETADEGEISFLANEKYKRFMGETQAAAVIVAEDYDGPGESLICCKDPYFAFRQAMVAFYGFRRHPFEGIDSRASIADTAEVAEDVTIGPFVTVADNAKIGRGTTLYPGVHVGPDVVIGCDCILYPNVAVYDGCKLGDRVTVHANSSIGQDGFGYATHAGRHEKIPQVGWVELHDDVEIGACCSIDRATLGATVVGAGTKFSNNIAIGHGTKLGKHCLMVAQSGIAGSTNVGDYAVFAAQCGVVGHINIGDGVRIGAQSGVVSDVPAGQEVLGSPHMPISLTRRIYATFTKLPEMRTAIKKLTRTLNDLIKSMRKNDKGPAAPEKD